MNSQNIQNFEQLYREFYPMVFTLTYRLSHAKSYHEEIEDIVQEVFQVVYKKLPTFRGDSSYKTWIYSITCKVVSYHNRKSIGWIKKILSFQIEKTKETDTAGEKNIAETELQNKELKKFLHELLDHLTAKRKEILILYEIEGLSGQEIADIMNISIDNTWTLLHLARKDLKELLKKNGNQEQLSKILYG